MIQRVIAGVFVAAGVLAAPAQAANFCSSVVEPGAEVSLQGALGQDPAPAPVAEPGAANVNHGLATPSGTSTAAPDEDGDKGKGGKDGKGKGGKGKGKGKGKGGAGAQESSTDANNEGADGATYLAPLRES